MERRVRALLFSLIFLVFVAVLLEGPWTRRKIAPKVTQLLLTLDTLLIQKVEIYQDTDTVVLKKKEGVFYVEVNGKDYLSASSMVGQALETLTKLRGPVVSRNPEKHSIFEVNDEKAIHVKLLGEGDTLLGEVLVGKTGPDYRTTYVREGGRDEVVLAEGYLRSTFRPRLYNWRNKEILKFEVDDVEMMEIAYRDKKLTIVRDTAFGWRIEKPDTIADTTRVNETLRYLSRLRAIGFGDTLGVEGTGLDNPDINLKISLYSGGELSIKMSKPIGNYFYIMREGDPSIYKITKFVGEKIRRNPEDFYYSKERKKKAQEKVKAPVSKKTIKKVRRK